MKLKIHNFKIIIDLFKVIMFDYVLIMAKYFSWVWFTCSEEYNQDTKLIFDSDSKREHRSFLSLSLEDLH